MTKISRSTVCTCNTFSISNKATIRYKSVCHPTPAGKMHLRHYAIIPLCECTEHESALFGVGSGDNTRVCEALQGICRCGMYCWAVWYVAVLFANWCFYSEFPVECYNGIMVMTACLHASEG